MTTEQEENVCLFCLEARKGRRQHTPIEFKGLFPCECIFQSHAECIIKWQLHCFDEIQCPICRVHLIVPEEETQLQAIVLFHPPHHDTVLRKKILFYFMAYLLTVFFLFLLFGFRF
jgi:hypothetical protein